METNTNTIIDITTETTIDSNNVESVQSMLDEHKEKIPDELYKNLCNILLEKHKKEEKKLKLVKITYIIPNVKNACSHTMYESEEDLVLICQLKSKYISFDDMEMINDIETNINVNGYHLLNLNRTEENFDEIDHENSLIEPYSMGIKDDSDDDDDTCEEQHIVQCNVVVVKLERL